MIGKKIKSSHGSHMKSGAIKNLSAYITNPNNGREKCVASGAENFVCTDWISQQKEMEALAAMARRGDDPICHYVVSWPADEQPTQAQAAEAVGLMVDHMGVRHCQFIWGMHHDTDNAHVHLMLNRIDPITERAVRINHGFDVEALQQAVAWVEYQQGWSVEANKGFAVMDDGQVAKVDRERNPIPPRVRDKELRTGEKSATRIAQEKALPIIQEAKSWDALHAGLAQLGMQYLKKGSGAVILVGADGVKVSDVSKTHASLRNLQKRLGEYQPPQPDLQMADRPVEPMPGQDHQAVMDRREAFARRKAAKVALDKQIQDERAALYQQQQERRKQDLAGDWKGKGVALNALRSYLAFEQAQEKAALQERHKQARKQFNIDHAIQLLPEYKPIQNLAKGIEQSSEWKHDIRDYQSIITGKSVSYVNRHGMVDFIDHGKTVSFTNTQDKASMLAGLQLSQQKFGKTLTLYGSDAFKQQAASVAVENEITIANPELQGFMKQAREQMRVIHRQQRKGHGSALGM